MGTSIGIDLGTTSSKIAYLQNGKTFAIKNKMFGTEFTPSIVGLNEFIHELKIGKLAENLTTGVISEIKRKMGEKTKVKLGDKEYSPEEISAMILKYLKEYGEDYLNDEISEVVISVPPDFTAEARNATETAAELAGLKVSKIIQEPIAAALAFGFEKANTNNKVLVYDLGGGTFNVSVINFTKNKINLVAFEGLKYLGGTNFDQRLVNFIKEHLKEEFGLTEIDTALEHRLKVAAIKAKESLSLLSSTNIKIPFIGIVNNRVINFNLDLSREKFDMLIEDLVDETIVCMDTVLKSGQLSKSEINKVILVGGSTRMPIIKEKVTNYFGFSPSAEIEPDLAVSFGAAIQAGMLKGTASSISWI